MPAKGRKPPSGMGGERKFGALSTRSLWAVYGKSFGFSGLAGPSRSCQARLCISETSHVAANVEMERKMKKPAAMPE
jgi:hypothetical protein